MQVSSSGATEYYIPLPFWFSVDPRIHIPIVAPPGITLLPKPDVADDNCKFIKHISDNFFKTHVKTNPEGENKRVVDG